MLKKITIIFLLLLFSTSTAYAAEFSLTHIGSLNTEGKKYSQWWYTGLRPTLKGTAAESSTITINIDGHDFQTTANDSGLWSYAPDPPLSAEDHAIVLTNNESVYNFTLTLGSSNVQAGSGEMSSDDTLPAAGILLPTLFLIISGAGTIVASKKFK